MGLWGKQKKVAHLNGKERPTRESNTAKQLGREASALTISPTFKSYINNYSSKQKKFAEVQEEQMQIHLS